MKYFLLLFLLCSCTSVLYYNAASAPTPLLVKDAKDSVWLSVMVPHVGKFGVSKKYLIPGTYTIVVGGVSHEIVVTK